MHKYFTNIMKICNFQKTIFQHVQSYQFYLQYTDHSKINKKVMKQLISMPSTKPQQFLYTDFSVVSPVNHPKYSLIKIINYIKNVLKMRIYLAFRDFQQIYNAQSQYLNKIFNVYSVEELWKKINKNNQQRLQQRQMVSFLTKIVIILTKQKNQCAETKKFEKFAENKYLIEWLEGRIIELENIIRDKIKQTAVKRRNELQLRRQSQFQSDADMLKINLQSTLEDYETKLIKRHFKEKKNMQDTVQQIIQNKMYVYRPSKKLSQAKDTSLLAKLAPFKSEKKRPFQCKSLQKQLEMTVEKGKQQTQKQIESFKRSQRQKVHRRHVLERDIFIGKIEQKNIQTLAKLEQKRNEMDKSQQIKMQKLLGQNNKATEQRILSLKKSLRAYSLRDEKNQIKKIIKQHRETIQFVNNIEQIGDTEMHKTKLPSSYVTLDLSSDWSKKNKFNRYKDERIENKILRKIRNTNMGQYQDDDAGLQECRKSLVNLYDNQLRQM